MLALHGQYAQLLGIWLVLFTSVPLLVEAQAGSVACNAEGPRIDCGIVTVLLQL